jgi:hypothetical protein
MPNQKAEEREAALNWDVKVEWESSGESNWKNIDGNKQISQNLLKKMAMAHKGLLCQ